MVLHIMIKNFGKIESADIALHDLVVLWEFHEFDNPGIDRSYIGKKVSYKIVLDGGQERAIDVRLI